MTKSARFARPTLLVGTTLVTLGSTAMLASCGTPSQKTSSVKQTASVGYLNTLEAESDFARLQGKVDEVPLIRYTVLLDEPGEPFLFHNTARYAMHLDFLKAEIPKYKDLTAARYSEIIDSPSQTTMQTGVAYYEPEATVSGVEGKGAIGFIVYLRSAGMTPEDARAAFAKAHARVSAAAPMAKGRVVLLLEGADFFKYKAPLEKIGVPVAKFSSFVKKRAGTPTNEPRVYNASKSYGYLKSLSAAEIDSGDYSSKDVVVLEEAPIDLAPVAGVITSQPQPPHSHVIMRAINQKIPDAFLPGVLESAEFNKYRGQLVEFETTAAGKVFLRGADVVGIDELARRAEAYFATRVPTLPAPQADLSALGSFAFVGKTLSRALVASYGAKGTNFALLDEALRASGVDRASYDGAFLIPFSAFNAHMAQAVTVKACEKATEKCAKGASVDACKPAADACVAAAGRKASVRDYMNETFAPAKVEALLGEAALRRGTLEFARQLVRRTSLPATVLEDVRKAIAAKYPSTVRMRLRSSTNAEDLEGLNGAGLYVSKSACLQDSLEKKEGPSACMTPTELARVNARIADLEARLAKGDASVARSLAEMREILTDKDELEDALRGVYASLWNDKAFLTRDYYRIDHSKVYMGVLAHPSFVNESANGVVVVNDNGSGLDLHIVAQKNDISVTNPELPGALPEEWRVKAAPGGTVTERTYVRGSSLQMEAAVLTETQVADLTAQIATVQAKFRSVYGDAAARLDIEYIVDATGKVFVKQARPL